MTEPDIVPSKLNTNINYKIILGIICAVIVFHIYVNYFSTADDSETIISIFSFLNPLAVSIASFIVAIKYIDAGVYRKASISLGFAYLMIFLGEITYLIYDLFLDIDPYPSIADVFFFLQYPLTLVYVILNIRFFSSFSNKYKAWVIILPSIILISYSINALNEYGEAGFDFYYGLIFVSSAGVLLAFSILGATIFRDGLLGKAWMILVIGILTITIGDIWYYYLELIGEYDLSDPVNLFWYSGAWIIIYALYKHKKII
ncbi:histidine kinase [Nitrosopumilus ureiphilus]|uniref:Histidine kinase n=1 Tax=Nitrosopumilus ureiphilus TaxID=1470067 RepID=A0A7D5R6G2_9ARCH|nr:histidine kinase [Nitrosopumilus ureiphilus]QLH06917.1 histidine kinase [Nitrosopumilus ureiphilus]